MLVAGSAVYKGDPAQEMRKILDSGRRAVGQASRDSFKRNPEAAANFDKKA